MQILYLAHRIPYPPNKGDKIRSFRQLEHLAARHRVWCACFVDRPEDERYVETLRTHCEDVLAIRLRGLPAKLRGLAGLCRGATITESFYRHRGMTGALRRWSESIHFDVVVAFSSSMASFALDVSAKRRVLDLCDLDSRKWLDYAAASRGLLRRLHRVEGERLALREAQWLASFDATIVITDTEAEPLQGQHAAHRLHVIGNGAVLPDESQEPSTPRRQVSVVGFVGAMDYRPNVDAVVWFVENCWSKLRAAAPDAEFRIVGRSPTRRVRRLARVAGVTVVGEVADVADELKRFTVGVAPMRIARGLQNKVLEAMASSKAVVLTSLAADGIDAQDRIHFLVADQPDAMVGDILFLLRDAASRAKIGRAARRYVETHHQWKDALREFELVVTGVADPSAERIEHIRPDYSGVEAPSVER